MQTGALDVADADSLLDAIALASAAEVTPNRWFINDADFITLRKLKETGDSNKYLLESDVQQAPPIGSSASRSRSRTSSPRARLF